MRQSTGRLLEKKTFLTSRLECKYFDFPGEPCFICRDFFSQFKFLNTRLWCSSPADVASTSVREERSSFYPPHPAPPPPPPLSLLLLLFSPQCISLSTPSPTRFSLCLVMKPDVHASVVSCDYIGVFQLPVWGVLFCFFFFFSSFSWVELRACWLWIRNELQC